MKKIHLTVILIFFVTAIMAVAQTPITISEPQLVSISNQTVISPQKQVVKIEGQKTIEITNDQVITIADRNVVNIEDNIISIEKTTNRILIKPTEDFISIENTSLDVKRIVMPSISIEIETPELVREVEIKREVRRLDIKSDDVIASTNMSLEVKDAKLYLIHEKNKFEIKVLPIIASENVKRIEPQEIKTMELKVENEKPVYEIKGVQSVAVTGGTVDIEIINKVDAETGNLTDIQILIKENNQIVGEGENELLIVENNRLVKLDNVTNKEIKREKLLVKSVKPLVAIEKIKTPVLLKKEKFVLQVKRDCVLPNKKLILRSDNYDFVTVEVDDISELIENDCVLKICDEEKVKEFVNFSKEVLKVEADEKIRKLELKKSTHDLVEVPQLKIYMTEDKWEVKEGQTSPYQQFVTPNEVKDDIVDLDTKQIYEKVKSFVWVSDMVLHNKAEKWMLPRDFLDNTSAMGTNPVKGNIASDCSEQANTLVSMLRASGVPAEDVRVALGKVNFSGNASGHAWVEIKEDGGWMVLEATSGPFYDDDGSKKVDRDGVSYDYWKYHEYPVVEVWGYYNDVYFTDQNEEVASGWSQHAETSLESDILRSFSELKEGYEFSIPKDKSLIQYLIVGIILLLIPVLAIKFLKKNK